MTRNDKLINASTGHGPHPSAFVGLTIATIATEFFYKSYQDLSRLSSFVAGPRCPEHWSLGAGSSISWPAKSTFRAVEGSPGMQSALKDFK